MKHTISTILGVAVLALTAFSPSISKLTSTKTHIKFFSTTPAEDIEANNYKSVSTIDTKSGEVVFSVPMQSFEFKKSLMQKHFNQAKFLDTKTHPKAKLIGKITNLSEVNFEKDGTYSAQLKGEMTIKGKTNPFSDKGTVTVSGSVIKVNSKFNITLTDYEIAFEKGKPSTNIAKTVEVTVNAEYQSE
jgi:polyisoprenoid-binding protein YceI